jgi:hypothetical protein
MATDGWEETKNKIPLLTMLKNNPIKGAVMTSA